MTPDVTPDAVALAEADEQIPFEEFFSNQNARDRGQEIAPATPPAPVEPPPSEQPEREEPEEAEPPKPRTEPPKPPPAKPRHDRQARVQEALTRQRQAERERDEARAQLASLQQGRPPAQQAAPPVAAPVQPMGEPTLQQFAHETDPYTSYILAKADYQANQRFQQQLQQQQQAEIEQRNRGWAQQLKQGLDGQWAKYKADHPDFESQLDNEVTGTLRYHGYLPTGEFDPGTQLGNLVAISGLAPDLLSWFSTHKDDFKKIQALEAPQGDARPQAVAMRVLQGIEFGRVIERLTGATERAPQAVSQARPPIRRPAAAALPAAGAPEDDNDDSEAALLRHIRSGNAAEGRHKNLRRLR